MQYTLSVDLDLPREKVIELFDNPEYLTRWQPGLVSYEVLEGKARQEGAKARMTFDFGKRKMEVIETITARDLPERICGRYVVNGTLNIQENTFTEIDQHTTRWTSKNEFRFKGFMMKLMGLVMPGAFKKQSNVYLKAFKKFTEEEKAAASKG